MTFYFGKAVSSKTHNKKWSDHKEKKWGGGTRHELTLKQKAVSVGGLLWVAFPFQVFNVTDIF